MCKSDLKALAMVTLFCLSHLAIQNTLTMQSMVIDYFAVELKLVNNDGRMSESLDDDSESLESE